ncbi:transient receptor potential cation channel subfamily M member 4-like [Clytia hemisphaerica]|uniref:Uncharacterized protein n=1 Tax=Clytia hemisphaerica TaxID=252671 RepID=A0A7M5WTC7_9CNID|eukprot:TCONS_00009204-protein
MPTKEEKIPLTPGRRMYNEEKKDVEKGKKSPLRMSTKVSPENPPKKIDGTTREWQNSLDYVKEHFKTYESCGDTKKGHHLVPCVHFGDVCFEDESHRRAKFIRMVDTTPPNEIFDLIATHLKYQAPQLALFFGNFKKTNGCLMADIDSQFHRTRSAWIFTNGLEKSINSFSAERCRTTSIQIGIISANKFFNDKKLTVRNQACKMFAKSDFGMEETLNTKCDVFLCVDDGSNLNSKQDPSVISKFRSSIATYLAEEKRIPSLGIFGKDCIIDDVTTMTSQHVPKIILPGRNGAIDALRIPEEEKVERDTLKFNDPYGKRKTAFRTRMVSVQEQDESLDVANESKENAIQFASEHVKSLYLMKKNEKLLEVILTILAEKYGKDEDQRKTVMAFTILWNQLGIAEKYFHHYMRELTIESDDFFAIFMLCIAYQRMNFLEHFNLFKPKKIKFNFEDLEILYGFGAHDGNTKSLLREEFEKGWKDADIPKLKLFTEMTRLNKHSHAAVTMEHSRNILLRFCKRICKSEQTFLPKVPNKIPAESSHPQVLEEHQIDIVNELFLWSVINGYQELSLWLWDKSYGDESFIRVLIGEEVNLQIKKKMENENIPMLPSKFNDNYETFRDMAVSFLNISFERDHKESIRLLCKKSEVYEDGAEWDTTPLDIAYEIDRCPTFVAHKSVTHLMDSIWTGAMPNNIAWWQVLLMFFCPPFILLYDFDDLELIKYKEVKENETEKVDGLHGVQIKGDKKLSFFKKWQFLLDAPITKFYLSLISYLVFLGFIIHDSIMYDYRSEMQWNEWVPVSFFLSYGTLEVRKILTIDKSGRRKFKEQYSDIWNIFGAILFWCYFVSMVSRLCDYEYGHIFMAITATFSVLMLVKKFLGFYKLGLYIIMIYRMFKEMIIFLFLMGVFLLAYGVGMNSLMAHNQPSLVNIILRPYFLTVLQQTNFMIDKQNTTAGITAWGKPRYSDHGEYVGWVYLIIYLLVGNVLILNLLIAVFGRIYDEVEEQSNAVWSVQRYQTVNEYVRTSRVPHPFSVIADIYRSLEWITWQCCCGQNTLRPRSLSMILYEADLENNKKAKKMLTFFEREIAKEVRKRYEEKNSNNDDVTALTERIEDLTKRIQTLKTKEVVQ